MRAAARVDFSGSWRSSTHQLRSNPYMRAASGHELPHAAGPCPRKRQRLESRLGLRQVDQVLRNAFFFKSVCEIMSR